MLTLQILRYVYPDAKMADKLVFLARSRNLFKSYAISATTRRLHFFLAQLGHESSGLKATEENLFYSAERLRQVWPSRFRTAARAARFAGQPEALANLVYGGRLGNTQPGDGYRYRGRGYIQLTGRQAYREVGKLTGLGLEDDPALALSARHALHVACGFWQWKGLNRICDSGDFTALTRAINGGTNGLADRQAWLKRVEAALGD